MRIESIKDVYNVQANQVINTQYTQLIDPKTLKSIVEVTVHKVTLYDSKGRSEEWTNAHSVDVNA